MRSPRCARTLALAFGLAAGESACASCGPAAPDAIATADVDAGQDADAAEVVDAAAETDPGDTKPDIATADQEVTPADATQETDAAKDCADPALSVSPTDLPDGSSCTTACPPPYPCTCGVCPWITTPKMLERRYGGDAVWTGEEVLVFGGAPVNANGVLFWPYTAERWNPSKPGGFLPIELPPLIPAKSQSSMNGFKNMAVWTGQVALVKTPIETASGVMYHLRFDPKQGKATYANLTNAPAYQYPAFASGKLVAIGIGPPTWKRKVGLYDPALDAWSDGPLPAQFIAEPEKIFPNYCWVGSGDDVYWYDVWFGVATTWVPGSGVDPSKPVTLRFHVPTKTWHLVPQTQPFALGYASLHCAGFDDGLFVWGWDQSVPSPWPTKGLIFRKSTGMWAPVPSLPGLKSTGGYERSVWTGARFVIWNVRFDDPKQPKPVYHPGWPLLFDPLAPKWEFLTPIGAPDDQRGDMAVTFGSDQVFMLGGTDGGDGAAVVHKDGRRLWLPGQGGKP
jgi:hypothetical protein